MNYELRIKNGEKIVPFIWINGKETEINVNAQLVKEGASFHIIGIFLGTGEQRLAFNTQVIHKSPKTKSRITLRGVFKDSSLFSNDGMIRINKGARGADGYFVSKILLFDNAKGRSVPSLEINENELKAGHASTIGRPDEQQLFYLRSRGLTQKEAENLIIAGFFETVLNFLSQKDKIAVKKRLKII